MPSGRENLERRHRFQRREPGEQIVPEIEQLPERLTRSDFVTRLRARHGG